MVSPISKTFVPVRLLVGLVLSVISALALLVLLFCFARIRLSSLIFAGVGIVGGIGVATTAYADACRACKTALESTALYFPGGLHANVAASVASAKGGDLRGPTQLLDAPSGHGQPSPHAVLSVNYCPSCKQVAQLGSSLQTQNDQGGSSDSAVSDLVVASGAAARAFVERVLSRHI